MLVAEKLCHAFKDTQVLNGVHLTVSEGETVALVGPSGSGKTTLLYCLAGLLRPDAGKVSFRGADIVGLGEQERSALRRTSFGFVFQSAELVPELTLRENIELPLELTGVAGKERRRRTDELLERLGLGAQSGKRPAKVSGGQAQRAAVARAVAHRPAVVFADEPTGALDTANGATVTDLLLDLAKESGSSIVLVTHDRDLAARAGRTVELLDGAVVVNSLTADAS
ncbi:ABC transporter ATP-binding protein [Streptomyces sp. NBC_01465]|uniref:ABC transporter ATP-binding protein n=1 Tax=Streptomyces sp. NBC_01465 TaxID=2903878 RepID=UPI002E36F1DE|nr:ABC transporter ATP-binding protein [Streptomyces sp. NBC_01465]